MIARHEMQVDRMDVWARLAAPVDPDAIAWRQDGRATQRDGKFFARFVCYIEANTVRERLDSVVPGEWDLTLELLPALTGTDDEMQACTFKARLQILGVIREDVGTGRDYKSAATDAFKRAAVRFGIGHELYSFEQNWVQVEGDSKYAKPMEDPATAYARRQEVPEVTGPRASDEPSCPKCGGRMWDNRATKRNPRAPDYKCRNRSCDGVVWPAKVAASAATPEIEEPMLRTGTDDIPF